ncbi:MAG: hypothetical protein WAZ14_01635 [Patescibacteria group bacterium]
MSWMAMLGQVSNFLAVLLKAVEEMGGSEADLNVASANLTKMRDLAAHIMGMPCTLAPVTIFVTIVRYVIPSFDELQRQFDRVDLGFDRAQFDSVDECKNVGTVTRQRQFVYIHLGRHASDAEVLAEHKLRGVRPATVHELLAHAANRPDDQYEFTIVALGSVVVDGKNRRVALLHGDTRGRALVLFPMDYGGWHGDYRFLAVLEAPMAI